MTTGNSNNSNYGFVTAGWCGNCGRRRGADGRCPNCDPWWTSPVFQVGGPIVLLISLALIVGISVFRGGADNGPRIAATKVNSSIPASYVSAAGYGRSVAPPVLAAPVISVPASVANYAPRPTLDEVRYQQLDNLRHLTAYVDTVVQQEQNARLEQSRANSSYPAPSVRATGRSLDANTASQL